MRLIDADRLKKRLGCNDSDTDEALYAYDEKELGRIIDKQPTAYGIGEGLRKGGAKGCGRI
jgi:hypothetical protein